MALEAKSKAHFLSLPDKLRGLSPDQKPEWGNMSAQHMVEHVVGSWRISNGRTKVKAVLAPKDVAQRRTFMLSDEPYPRNLANPLFSKGLPPLRKASLNDAIDQLEDEMRAFFAYHESHPDAVETHPIYGDMTFEEWLHFQAKHMGHHLAQFGL